jgi:hypothetical protein
MILNAYTVLDGFATLLRLLLGLLVVGLGVPAWWRWRGALPSERRSFLEDRSYLLFLAAVVLLTVNVLSWPLLYLLLQSYVTEWPGVMCIYGVTRVGAGSLGPSRFLPGLLTALQATKPALVFLSGAWFVLYLLNRRTVTAPLTRRVLLAVVLVGALAVADAVAEGAYLVIPKKEETLSSGCCTLVLDAAPPDVGSFGGALQAETLGPLVSRAYYVVNVGMLLALTGYLCLPGSLRTGRALLPLAVGALVSWPVNLAFLAQVAAPALLHLPNHHCPYDLIPAVPESVVAAALFAAGSFAVGWACLAHWLGSCAETRPFLRPEVGRLLFLGLVGYAGSVAMLSFELALA